MKTKIKDTIKKCVQLAYENRQSWRLWITVTAFLIISLGTYAVSAMHYNTKTAYTTPPSTSETEKNRNSTRNGISDIPSSTRPKDSQEPESDKTTQDSQKDTESTTQSTSDATKPAGSTPSATPKSTSSSNTIKPPTSTPPSTPTPTSPTPTPSISGQSVPKGDIGNWKHVFYDDFTKDAALGSWGEDWDANTIVYTGAQSQQWRAYPKSYKDTYDKRPYRSDKVLSVKGSILNFWLHTVDGVPAGANPSPIIANGSQYQTYGRYSARFKVDTPNLNEYYVAWLLWPQSERWPQDGEIDFPEGNLAGNVGGFHHYSGAGSCANGCQDVASVPANRKFTDWHTYTIEWSPGRVKFILDNTVVLNSTNWVPSGPMRWQLQTETKGNGSSSGNLMVDWVSVWSYRP